jgi:transforming growth factor-beta-induced protein
VLPLSFCLFSFFHINITAELVCGVDDFSTLCSLLSSFSGLVDDLSSGSWTVFAPTNAAFERLNDEVKGGLQGIDDGLLKRILLFHTVNGQKIYAGDLSCMTGDKSLISMSNGKDARIKCNNGIPFGIKGNGNEEPVEFAEVDVEACNGIIHIIDNVLLFK